MIAHFGEFAFELDALELRREGDAIKVDPIVLRLLKVLVSNVGKLVTRKELAEQVWNGQAVTGNSITVGVARLRKALGRRANDPDFVTAVYGRGYRFVAPIRFTAPAANVRRTLPASALASPPFVGRERVLRELYASLAEVDSSAGRAWVLSGEPGIGKTRLVEEFEREVTRAGTLVAWGHCPENAGTPPLWPFTQILRQVLQQGARQADVLDWQSRSRHQTFDTVIQILTRASKLRPYVIVLDDLHRADALSLELLQWLIDLLPRTKIMLVATLSHIALDLANARAPLTCVFGHRNASRVRLQRLSEGDVSRYARMQFDDPDGVLGRMIYEKSEGNPFLMRELTHQLWGSARAGERDLAVPSAVLEPFRRGIASLDEEARGVLAYAAVIGRRFELPLLKRASGRGLCRLMSSIDSALERSAIIADADSRTAFKFAHELWRVALYEPLSPAQRRTLHRTVAVALEEHSRSGNSVAIADVAFHFHAALPVSDLDRTVLYCRAAAHESVKLSAYTDALRHLRHAHQAVDLMERPNPRLRASLLKLEELCSRGGSAVEFALLAREPDEADLVRHPWRPRAAATARSW